MAMPIDLVLVRHGQSEGNLVNYRARKGDTSLYTPEYKLRHDSAKRLTPKGARQAEAAGKWLRENGLERFDRRYVSTYVRAMETAGLLNLEGADWMQEPMLREREWGDFDSKSPEDQQRLSMDSVRVHDTDPFYWIPPNGESIAQVAVRLRTILSTLHRECFDKRVVIVCHGDVMWAFRFILERMSVDQWSALNQSDAPTDTINNCQILHYTRRSPVDGSLSERLDWLRSVDPMASEKLVGWQTIERRRFTNQDLLEMARQTPLLFPEEDGF